MRTGTGCSVWIVTCVLVVRVAGGATPCSSPSLRDALERLRAKGMHIIYSSELVRPEMRVDLEPSGSTSEEVLDQLLAPHGLAVSRGPGGALLVVPATAGQVSGTIQGVVRAGDTAMPLAGAEIRVAEAGLRARTGPDGRFEIRKLAPGAWTLEVLNPGYATTTFDSAVSAGETVELAVELPPEPRLLQEVVVTPSQLGLFRSEPAPRQLLDREEVDRLPHLWEDPLRMVQRLPGAAGPDISAQFGLRGGSSGEVQLILDGLPIEDPYHLRGLMRLQSVVDDEIVGGVEVLSGGYPVEYGGSTGGVVEITSVEPARDRYVLGLSGLSARALVARAAGQANGPSWQVAVRRGYAEWVFGWLQAIDKEPAVTMRPVVADAYGAFQVRVGTSSLLAGHLLAARDGTDAQDTVELHRSHGASTRLHLWATLSSSLRGGLSSRTIVSSSWRSDQTYGSSEPDAVGRVKVADRRSSTAFGLKQDWAIEPGRSHLLKWGADVRRVAAQYSHYADFVTYDPVFTGTETPLVIHRHLRLEPSGWQVGLYSADRVRVAPGVTVEIGARWDHQAWIPGEAQLSPRLNVVWDLGEPGTLRGAWGRYTQAESISELPVEDGVTAFSQAQVSEQRTLSFDRRFANGQLAKIEAYHFTTTRPRPRFENLFDATHLFPEGEADRVLVAPDRTEARGLEITVKGQVRKAWSWWGSYALATVDDRIAGQWVPRCWDQRHTLNLATSWEAGRTWSLSLAWQYHSGWPATPITERWVQGENGWEVEYTVGARNSSRHASYQRLDLRATHSVAVRSGKLRLFFEITNVFNTNNPRIETLHTYRRQPYVGVARYDSDEAWVPFLPVLGLVWEL